MKKLTSCLPIALILNALYLVWLPGLLLSEPIGRAPIFDLSEALNDRSPDRRGEISVFDSLGKLKYRVRGFKSVAALKYRSPNSVIAIDDEAHKIYELDTTTEPTKLLRTWNIPESLTRIRDLEYLSNDAMLVVLADGSIHRIGERETEVIPTNIEGEARLWVESMARLSDDTIILAAKGVASQRRGVFAITIDAPDVLGADNQQSRPARYSLRRVQGASRINPVEPEQFPFIERVGDRILLFDGSSQRVCYAALSDLPHKIIIDSCQAWSDVPLLIAGSLRGRSYSISFENRLTIREISGSESGRFTYEARCGALAYNDSVDTLMLGCQWPTISRWPEYAAYRANPWDIGSWRVILSVIVPTFLALTFGALFSGFFSGAAKERESNKQAIELESELSSRMSSLLHWISAIALVTALVYAAFLSNQQLQLERDRSSWGSVLLVIAVAFSLFMRYIVKGDFPAIDISFSSQSIPLRAVSQSLFQRCYFAILILILIAGTVGTFLESMRFDDFNNKIIWWFVALVAVFAVLLLDLLTYRRFILDAISKQFLGLLLLGGVCGVTFFYRLETIPLNTHFDFSHPILWALRILNSEVFDLWREGYTPVPIAGLFPELLGVASFGPTPLGFRVGSAIFALLGVFSVYILGWSGTRGLRMGGPLVGLWAAIFLSGNAVYMHFARMTTCGSAITVAICSVSLFFVAWRVSVVSIWILLGLFSGYTFYHWPVSRVGLVSVAMSLIWVAFSSPRATIARWRGLSLALLGFLVMLAPLIYGYWRDPGKLFPRANSLISQPVRFAGFFGWLDTLFGQPFLDALGWFFYKRDHSSQGSVWPALNSYEAALFACGLATLVVSYRALRVSLLPLLLITLIVCGSLTVVPWHTRLLPTVLVAAISMALCLHQIAQLITSKFKGAERVVSVLLTVLAVIVSPVINFERYVNYEEKQPRRMHVFEAIGRRIYQFGPDYEYGLVNTGNASWALMNSYAYALPYIMKLKLQDIPLLEDQLPISNKGRFVFIVQPGRFAQDFKIIREYYPDVREESVTDNFGIEVAKLVIKDR